MWLRWECSFPFMSVLLHFLMSASSLHTSSWWQPSLAGITLGRLKSTEEKHNSRWLKFEALSSSPSMGLFMWLQYSFLSCYKYSPLQYMHPRCIAPTHKPITTFSLKCGKSESTDFALTELPDSDGCSFLSCISTIGVFDKCITWAEWYPVS